MIIFNPEFQHNLSKDVKVVKIVLQLFHEFDETDPFYFTSHTDCEVPTGTDPSIVAYNTIGEMSTISQSIDPINATSTIGSFSFSVVDIDEQISTHLRSKYDNNIGLRHKIVRIFVGFDYVDNEELFTWDKYEVFGTYVIDEVKYNPNTASYVFNCSDLLREVRKDIFQEVSAYISQDVAITDTTIYVNDASIFLTDPFTGDPRSYAIPHGPSYQDAAGTLGSPVNVIYFQIDKETVRVLESDVNTSLNRLENVQRGVLGTVAAFYDYDATKPADKQVEVSTKMYIELPDPKFAYAVMTGSLSSNQPGSRLPDPYHAGIDPKYVRYKDFYYAGNDLWNPTDDSGLVLRFVGEDKTDAKQFLEEQLYRAMGAFPIVYANGEVGLKRMVPVLPNAIPHYTFDKSSIISISELNYGYENIYNNIKINWNKNHITDRTTRTSQLVDNVSEVREGEAPEFEITLDGIHGSIHTANHLRWMLDCIRNRYAGVPIELEIEAGLPSIALSVGDIVRVDLDQIRDYTQSDTSNFNRVFEIQEITTDFVNKTVRLRLFGSTQKAESIDYTEGSTNVLSNATYTWLSTGATSLTTYLDANHPGSYSISGGVLHILSPYVVDLDGDQDDYWNARYYYNGPIQVDEGATVNFSYNVFLINNGFCQWNGVGNGKGLGLAGGTMKTYGNGPAYDTSDLKIGNIPAKAGQMGQTKSFGTILVNERGQGNHSEFKVNSWPGMTFPGRTRTVCNVTNGSPNVTITGGWGVYDGYVGKSFHANDGQVYFIQSVTDSTHFVLTTNYDGDSATDVECWIDQASVVYDAIPELNIECRDDQIFGLPKSFLGNPGSSGSAVFYYPMWSSALMLSYPGTAGAKGGASLMILSKGGEFGLNGYIDTSGGDAIDTAPVTLSGPDPRDPDHGGTDKTRYKVNPPLGAPGAPGGFVWLIDGDNGIPNFTYGANGNVRALVGDIPWQLYKKDGTVEPTSISGYPDPTNPKPPALVESTQYGTVFRDEHRDVWNHVSFKVGYDELFTGTVVDCSKAYSKYVYLKPEITPVEDLETTTDNPTAIVCNEITNEPKTPLGNLSTIEVTVTPGSSPSYSYANVYYRAQGQDAWIYGTAASDEGLVVVPSDGTIYEFMAVGVSKAGIENTSGPTTTIQVTNVVIIDDEANPPVQTVSVPNVSGLELFDEGGGKGNDTNFVGKDIKLRWIKTSLTQADIYSGGAGDPIGAGAGTLDLHFQDYQVEVWNPDTDTLVRTEHVLDNTFLYTFEKNVQDFGTARRTIRFEVYCRGTQNTISATPAKITVTNPAPGNLIDLAVTPGIAWAAISFTAPTDLDYQNTRFYLKTSSITVPDETYFVTSLREADEFILHFDAAGNILDPATTYYGLAVAVDSFGESAASYQTFSFTTIQADDAWISDLGVNKLTAGTINAAITLSNYIQVGTGGNIRMGQTAYDTGTGFWLGDVSGTAKFSIGNSSGNKLTWNGTNLALTGSITASSGTIGGFTIGSTTLTSGNFSIDSATPKIQTASSGARVIIDGSTNRIEFYNSSGTNTISIGNPSYGSFVVSAKIAAGDEMGLVCTNNTSPYDKYCAYFGNAGVGGSVRMTSATTYAAGLAVLYVSNTYGASGEGYGIWSNVSSNSPVNIYGNGGAISIGGYGYNCGGEFSYSNTGSGGYGQIRLIPQAGSTTPTWGSPDGSMFVDAGGAWIKINGTWIQYA